MLGASWGKKENQPELDKVPLARQKGGETNDKNVMTQRTKMPSEWTIKKLIQFLGQV